MAGAQLERSESMGGSPNLALGPATLLSDTAPPGPGSLEGTGLGPQ